MKSKKITKIIGAGGLAIIMCAGVLCGVLVAPMHSAQASVGGGEAPASTASPLGLDPENDPVICTTESGLEIKFGAATLSSGALTGYTYFTMGAYSGIAVNWVIIGRHSSTTSGTTAGNYPLSLANWFNETPYGATVFENWLANEKETTTPAGSSIDLEWDKQEIVITKSSYSSINLTLSSKEVINDEDLDPGEVLVISETNICNAKHANNYNDSPLKTKMDTLFESELGFTDAQKKLIIPQYLKNLYTGTSYTSSAFLFPLASRGENFNAATYLTSAELRVSYNFNTKNAAVWWLRSGNSSSYQFIAYVEPNGNIGDRSSSYSIYESGGVRPAFVLKII